MVETCRLSAKAENGYQRLINSPHLLGRGVTNQPPQTRDIDSPDLLDQNERGLAFDLYLGTKGCGASAPRCRGDEDDRPW
jgi:hypothetical protein